MTSKSSRILSRRRAIAAAMFGFGTLTIPAQGLNPFQLDVGGGRIDVGFVPGDSTRGAMPSAGGSPTLANPSLAISDASQSREPLLRSTLRQAGAAFSVELLMVGFQPTRESRSASTPARQTYR